MKVLALALGLFCISAHADDGILVIGDSTSLGAMPYIKESLSCVVHAPGNSRDSDYIFQHIASWLAGKDYRIIYLNSGLWDIARRIPTPDNPWKLDPTDQAPVSDDELTYEGNLRSIIRIIRIYNHNAQIIFATSTDVPSDSAGRLPIDIRKYNKYAKAVMADMGVEVDDRYAFMLPYAYLHKIDVPNKVHYLPAGYQVMASHEIDVFQAHGGC